MIKLLLGLCLLFSHEFYLSVSDVEFDSEKERLQVTIKLFTDDLEKSLEMNSGEKLFLGSDKENPTADDILDEYIDENFIVKVNGKELENNLLGKKVDLDRTVVYLEISAVDELETIHITNTLLVEQFEKQSNIVHIKKEDDLQTMLFNRHRLESQLTFD